MKPTIIFLDNGGVLHDNERRKAEWGRLVGEYLAPRLGGEPSAWGEANRIVFDAQWTRFEAWSEAHARDDHYVDFFKSSEESFRWLAEMCDSVGVRTPTSAECIALAESTQRYVRSRVRSGFDDAAPGVRALFDAGYTLATASGETSEELDRYMAALGVRECFTGRLYGPDLVNAQKASPRYYQRILADVGIEPVEALFVDDTPNAVAWAAEAGARAVHMCRQGEPAPAADHVVGNLLEVVDLLREA